MMNIISAKKSDLKGVLALQKDCYQEEAELYNDFSIPPLTQSLVSIQEDYENQTFLIIKNENKIIGSVRGFLEEDGTCKIGRLIVAKAFRNKGLGKKLMSKIANQFTNANRFELFTGHKSEKNLSLYQKLGYSEFDRKKINEKLELVFLEKIIAYHQ